MSMSVRSPRITVLLVPALCLSLRSIVASNTLHYNLVPEDVLIPFMALPEQRNGKLSNIAKIKSRVKRETKGLHATSNAPIRKGAPSEHGIPKAILNACYLKANRRHIFDKDRELVSRQLPTFMGIVQTPDRLDRQQTHNYTTGNENDTLQYYWTAHFSIVHLTWGKKRRSQQTRIPEWSELATWRCDDEPAQLIGGGDPKGIHLTVKCPQTNDTLVYNITVQSPSAEYTYYVHEHVQCERNDPLLIPKPNTTTRQPQLVAAAMILHLPVETVLEWVEYHRLIGYHHFLIYVMDKDLHGWWPQLDYITYIPHQLNPITTGDPKNMYRSQPSVHMNAIHRTRALGWDWLALNDVDEFVVTHKSLSLLDYVDRFTNDPEISSVQLESFGCGSGSTKQTFDYTLEYTYRTVKSYGNQRCKNIVRPSMVDYYNIHWVTLALGKTHRAHPQREAWLNHYRNPEQGTFSRALANRTLVHDASVRDRYLTLVRERTDYILSHRPKGKGA